LIINPKGEVRVSCYTEHRITSDSTIEESDTLRYMSLEQIRKGRATEADDVYSFAMVAYQVRTTTLPETNAHNSRER
jgi:hypothetical protein